MESNTYIHTNTKKKKTKAAWTVIKVQEVQSRQPLCGEKRIYNTFTFCTINIELLVPIIIIMNNVIKMMLITVTFQQKIFTKITVLTHQSETQLHKRRDVHTSLYVTIFRG